MKRPQPFTILILMAFSISCKQNTNNSEPEAIVKQDSIYVVDLKAMDYAFAMPAEIPSGWITFRMENMGDENHIALIYRSESDLSIEELRSMIDSSNYDFPKTPVGGPGRHSPGQKSDVTVHLEPGNYMMYCTIATESGENHAELGMQTVFRVSEKSSGAIKPDPDTRIILQDYDMRRTETFATGRQIVEIVHDSFPGGFHLFDARDSLSIKSALQQMNGEIGNGQVQWLTGAEPAAPGRSSFISYNFSPGEYAWVSHAYVWGAMDRFRIEEGDTENRPVNKEEEANKIEVSLQENDLKINGKIEKGINIFHLENNRDDKAPVFLVKISGDMNKESFLAWWESTSEGENPPILGVPALLKEEAAVTLEMQAGKYLITCAQKGGPCFTDGIKEFVVD